MCRDYVGSQAALTAIADSQSSSPHLHTHTHTASANPLLGQQVGKLVSQSLRLARCSAGISMRISRTKSKHAESRQAGKERCEAGFICTKWLCKWDSLLTSECVNIIMARARPMQTGRTARTRGRATCCACVPLYVYVCARCAAVRLMSNTFALESTATWPLALALDFVVNGRPTAKCHVQR